MSDFTLLDASMILGIIGVAIGVFIGIPLKLKVQRLDRLIAEHEAEARREAEQAATRL